MFFVEFNVKLSSEVVDQNLLDTQVIKFDNRILSDPIRNRWEFMGFRLWNH
jgi:hypothetical protein